MNFQIRLKTITVDAYYQTWFKSILQCLRLIMLADGSPDCYTDFLQRSTYENPKT
jgi:hypothetical protein